MTIFTLFSLQLFELNVRSTAATITTNTIAASEYYAVKIPEYIGPPSLIYSWQNRMQHRYCCSSTLLLHFPSFVTISSLPPPTSSSLKSIRCWIPNWIDTWNCMEKIFAFNSLHIIDLLSDWHKIWNCIFKFSILLQAIGSPLFVTATVVMVVVHEMSLTLSYGITKN